MSVIEVTTTTLRNDVETIRGDINTLRRQSAQLQQVVAQLSAMWEGEANASFTAAVNSDLQRLEALISNIDKFTSQTDTVRSEYERCESRVEQIISSIRV